MAPRTIPPTTREELEALAVIDPDFEKATTDSPLPPPLPKDHNASFVESFLAHREQRAAHLQKLRHLYPIPGPVEEVEERMHKIRMRDGHEIDIKIYSPTEQRRPEAGCPLVVMFHEGGWSMGDLTDEDLNCRMFARDLGCVCVNVDYRLAPEHPFPVGINDSWDALRWIAANATSPVLGADPSLGFVTGGASAGANISAVMSQLARDNALSPPLTGTYLCVPSVYLDQPENLPGYLPSHLFLSKDGNRSDPVLGSGTDTDALLREIYKMDPKSTLASPLLDPERGVGLPRCYLQVAGMDPLRDDGVLYEWMLREVGGVQTRLEIYGGYGHMFFTNWPTIEAAVGFVADTREGMKWLLEKRA